MKKSTMFLCSCFILISLLPGALAAPGDALLFTQDQRNEWGIESSVSSTMASIADTVYILCGSEIYAWQAGWEKPDTVAAGLESGYYATYDEAEAMLGDKADTLIYGLVSSKDTVYGLNWLNGKLFPLAFDNGNAVFGPAVQLDWSGLAQTVDDRAVVKEAYRLIISGNSLYGMFRNNEEDHTPVIAVFDLSTGAKQILDIPFAQDMALYKDGKLLIKIFDGKNAGQGGDDAKKPTLAVYDPANDSVSTQATFADMDVFGLAYQEQADTLYYATTSKLMAMNGLGTARQITFVPAGFIDSYTGACSAALLPGGYYVLNTPGGLVVRNTDPQYMPTGTLSIYGGKIDTAFTTFSQKYPQTPVTLKDDVEYVSASALAQSMVSGDNHYDIYRLLVHYQDLQELIRKGYCADLSSSPVIDAALSNMYPFLEQAVTQNGKAYAIPVYMGSHGLCIIPDVWEEAGLQDKMPSSFIGLLDFIAWWAEEGQDQHPDVQLMQDITNDIQDYGETLYQIAMGQYVYDCQGEGKALSLDTPLFRNMMQTLEKVDVEKLNKTIASSPLQNERDANALLTNYGDWLSVHSGARSRSNAIPLILPMEDGGAKHIPVFIEVLFINPFTNNMDLARQYLENAMACLEPDQHVMMYPNDNEPVAAQGSEEMVAGWQKELEKQQKLLKKAKPEAKSEIEANIQSYEALLANDVFYWAVSAESIARYRELVPFCYTATPNLLNYQALDGSSEINTLIDRYRQKKMTVDQFISEADSRIKMILIESQ